MNRHRIKLLVTLVLFALAVTSVWMPSPADARGPGSLGVWDQPVTTPSDADISSGDPDAGQNIAPPPPPSTKRSRPSSWSGSGLRTGGWFRWTSWIWATLSWRAAR